MAKDAAEAIHAAVDRATKPKRRMISVPHDASEDFVRMFHVLKTLAARGCSRTVPPSTCRQTVAGYPRPEWCEGCMAADALGIDSEWFQLR